jgi:hypothetical protein
MKSFIDKDWTGLDHRQIWNAIRAELEEQQCKEDGHKWVPVYYCRACGLRSEDALEEFKKQMTTKKGKMSTRHVK